MKRNFLIIFLFLCASLSNSLALVKDIPFYRLGPGDIIEINVWEDERLNRQIIIPPDGIISYPFAGDIKASGRTTAELREILTERLKGYIQSPTVSVMLIEAKSLKAYVIGKVNRPGEYPIELNTDVMQILSMAGGLTPFASSKKILILRREGDKIIKIPFNYEEVIRGKHLEQNILLKRGDIIVVP